MHNIIEQGLKTNKKRLSKLDNMLTSKFTEAGRKERYCLTELFNYLNFTNDTYKYSFSPTSEDESIGFDGTLIISHKLTGTIKAFYLVEAKVRTKVYDTFVFEQKKLNTLKSYKRKLDKYFKAEYSDKTINLMYVSFTEEATFMYDLLTLIDNHLMPKLTKMKMNKVTVESRDNKINKHVFLLPQNIAVKYKWNFNEREYNLSRINKAQQEFNSATEEIKKYYSIF